MIGVDIVITNRSGAEEILCSPSRCADVAYVISIGTPVDRPPAGLRNVGTRLRLEFEDVLLESDGGPSADDIARLIQFAQGVVPARGVVVVHCQGGISRSTAAAAIVLAVALGPGKEESAIREVFRIQPHALPNGRMLELADAALDNGGALASAAAAYPAAQQGDEADEA